MINKPVLVHITASLSLGGAETVLFNLVRGLKPYYTQQVISLHHGPFKERIEALGISVIVLDGKLITQIQQLWQLLNEINPTVIHSLLWSANALMRVYARQHHVPLVCAIHSPFNANSSNSKWRTLFDRLTASWAQHTIFVAPGVRQQALIAPYVHDNYTIIPNGIAIDDIHKIAQQQKKERAELGLKPTDFVIGTVGRLVPVKNHLLLIQLIDYLHWRHDNIRLVIIGQGPLHDDLEHYIQKLQVQQYVSLVPGTGAAHYQLFNCFVQPSFTEGLSMALLEAMLFKIPVLASSTTGTHDVIHHNVNGFLFSPTNVQELAKLVEQLLNDKSLCNTFGNQAYQTVKKNFDVNTMVTAYKQVIDRLL